MANPQIVLNSPLDSILIELRVMNLLLANRFGVTEDLDALRRDQQQMGPVSSNVYASPSPPG